VRKLGCFFSAVSEMEAEDDDEETDVSTGVGSEVGSWTLLDEMTSERR
jgi:hypothetical protein